MLLLIFHVLIFFCWLVTGRPLRSEPTLVINNNQLFKRARAYSVVPVDGSNDSTTSSALIKTSFITTVETTIITKVVTVAEDPVTETVRTTISVVPTEPCTSLPESFTDANRRSLSAQKLPVPTSTANQSMFSRSSEDFNGSTITTTQAANIATMSDTHNNEQAGPTNYIYLYSYRWSNSTFNTLK